MSGIPTFDPQCFANHMGLWCIETSFLSQALMALRSGVVPDYRSSPYDISVQDGTAVVPIIGPMMRGQSKFGGTSTVQTSRVLNRMAAREDVNRILLYMDTPGGTVDGTPQLARTIRRVREGGKRVDAHIENLGASAGYWVASQAERVTISPESEAGSIGVMMQLFDTSGRAALEGVRSVVIKTGPLKGVGLPGEPIADDEQAYLQARVDEIGGHFFSAVQTGRRLTDEQLDAVTTGEVFGAERAQALGLVDAVLPWEDAYSDSATPTTGRIFSMADQQEPMVAVPTSLFERIFGSRQEPKVEAVPSQPVAQDLGAAFEQARQEGFAAGKAAAEQEIEALKHALTDYKARVQEIIDTCVAGEQLEVIPKAFEEGWGPEAVHGYVTAMCAAADNKVKIDSSVPEKTDQPVATNGRPNREYLKRVYSIANKHNPNYTG